MVLEGISNGLGNGAPTIRRVTMMRRANENGTWLQPNLGPSHTRNSRRDTSGAEAWLRGCTRPLLIYQGKRNDLPRFEGGPATAVRRGLQPTTSDCATPQTRLQLSRGSHHEHRCTLGIESAAPSAPRHRQRSRPGAQAAFSYDFPMVLQGNVMV